MEQILKLIKQDLGIAHNERDRYFYMLTESIITELKEKGIDTDINAYEDVILIVDIVLWRYRHRTDDVPLAQNIAVRIRDRRIKKRAYI